ncbi:hypothetical protein U1Q18_043944 [Sarracenia purpurea var. burkii]
MNIVKIVELFIRMKSRIVLIGRVVSLGYGMIRLYAFKRIEALLREWAGWRQHRQKEADIRKLLEFLKSIPMEKKTKKVNILRLLSPHLRIFLPYIFFLSFIFFMYLICLYMCLIPWFLDVLSKGGFILGGRALSFALFKLGCSCSAGLALTVGFALKALLTGEGFTNMMAPEDTPSLETRMLPTGEGTSGAKCPLPSSEDSPVRSISTQGSSWIDRVFGGTGGEATSNPTNRGNLETSSPAVSQQGDFRGENEPQPSPPLPRVETPGISQLAEGAAAPPAPAPPAEAVPPAMAISQADYNAFRQLLSNHQRIQSSLLQLFRELRTHVPGGFQAERLTEMLEEEHGGDKMGEILMSLQTEGRQSPYFKEAHRDFQYFRNNKITEMSLRRQWQGRGAP